MHDLQKLILSIYKTSRYVIASYLRNYVTIVFIIFLMQTCIYELYKPCQCTMVARNERLIDKINSSEIRRNGMESNLTNHDRRTIINRVELNNQTLMEIKYVISRNG